MVQPIGSYTKIKSIRSWRCSLEQTVPGPGPPRFAEHTSSPPASPPSLSAFLAARDRSLPLPSLCTFFPPIYPPPQIGALTIIRSSGMRGKFPQKYILLQEAMESGFFRFVFPLGYEPSFRVSRIEVERTPCTLSFEKFGYSINTGSHGFSPRARHSVI